MFYKTVVEYYSIYYLYKHGCMEKGMYSYTICGYGSTWIFMVFTVALNMYTCDAGKEYI